MGVPKFYRWISERYPCLSEIVRDHGIPDFDNLYLDMNGIIHACSHPNDEDVHFRISQEQIAKDIFKYIEFLFNMIKPRKVFFMAIDGVAPRAKQNQQRGRRFRSAKDAEAREKEAMNRGEVLPEESRFDSNCITPGTYFMVKLQEQLKYFVSLKISTDKLWRNVTVILSGHETPGEGEHKIMDFIRYQKSQLNYDPNTRHCLYGLDADLIMLGMCSHEPYFSLLREEVKFIKPKRDEKKNFRSVNPENITWHLLHLSLLRDYLDHEFSSLKEILPFEYNLENIIDDWILMGFLCGNDFIPHVPHFHIIKDTLGKLYYAYKNVLPHLGGFINEGGRLNLSRFSAFLKKLSDVDYENWNDVYCDLKYFNEKTKNNSKPKPNKELINFYQDSELDGTVLESLENDTDTDNENIDANLIDLTPEESDCDVTPESMTDDEMSAKEFRIHKNDYYKTKMRYKKVDKEVLQEQANGYIRAIQWNLHYYYNGCMSWSWYYPHHYAPFISDIKDFDFNNVDLTFEEGEPFRPFEQLLAVLPAASKSLLPRAYQKLVTEANSPLIQYYPDKFELDMNEKTQSWEAIVVVPFIDENILLDSAKKCETQLNDEEKNRNKHGPHLVYTYTTHCLSKYKSPLPTVFPDIEFNHAECKELAKDAFHLPIDKIRKGLPKGIDMDLCFLGFPKLKYLDYTATLRKQAVRVFDRNAQGDSIILKIEPKNFELPAAAQEYLGKTVYVNWPHIVEALVIRLSDGQNVFFLDHQNRIVCNEISDTEREDLEAHLRSMTRIYNDRKGIDIGETKIIAVVNPISKRKGEMNQRRKWAPIDWICPFQTLVKDIKVYRPPVNNYFSDYHFAKNPERHPNYADETNRPRRHVQKLDHSPNSPFESPKIFNKSTDIAIINNGEMNDMNKDENMFQNMWKSLQNIKQTNQLHPSTSAKGSSINELQISTPPKGRQVSVEELMKSAEKMNLKTTPSTAKHLNNISHKSSKERLIEYCLKTYGPEKQPTFKITEYGPMKNRNAMVILPDVQSFVFNLNKHETEEIGIEKVSEKALINLNMAYQNNQFNNPVEEFIRGPSLPKPPQDWISFNKPPNIRQRIPESFVQENSRILQQHLERRNIPQQEVYYNYQQNYPMYQHHHHHQQQQRMNSDNRGYYKEEIDHSNRPINSNHYPSQYAEQFEQDTLNPRANPFIPLQVARINQASRNKQMAKTPNEPKSDPIVRQLISNDEDKRRPNKKRKPRMAINFGQT